MKKKNAWGNSNVDDYNSIVVRGMDEVKSFAVV